MPGIGLVPPAGSGHGERTFILEGQAQDDERGEDHGESQYGGHCSSGAAKGGNTANVDPEAWAIVDGRLYLQYSIAVLEAWERAP